MQLVWSGCTLLGLITLQPVLFILLRVLLIDSDYVGFLSSMCTHNQTGKLHQTGWQADLDVGVSTVMLRTSSSASLSRPCLTGLVTTTYLHTFTQ